MIPKKAGKTREVDDVSDGGLHVVGSPLDVLEPLAQVMRQSSSSGTPHQSNKLIESIDN